MPVYVWERPDNAVLTSEEVLRARTALFKRRGRTRKQFSQLWRSCEAHASLFMCGKDLITPFHPPRKTREAHAGLFKFQRRSRKQFSPL